MTHNDRLRIAEVADLLSLPENLIRHYADMYDEFLPHITIGKVRIYEQSALKQFRIIGDLSAQGMSYDGIISVLRGGKTPQERALDHQDEKQKLTTTHPPPPPRPDLLDEVVIAVHRTLESTTRIDHRIGSIRDGMAADTHRILHEISVLRDEVQQSQADIRTLWSQVRELEEDLRERELRKSWLERVAKRISR
ncbi:MAG: MerR family transcriptional regulator [Methanocalculus sp. MSAO_Arc2]|uniref:MerR family transcriptional regulator n=1 Tax=Methanocalculus sp. MSAO_Arc2 TaxID=2293855 RepID=UPI000FF537B4|nr:MAG: MerR family transcriptional regulator [Methanocalculus sp. MSAO_Arc2]